MKALLISANTERLNMPTIPLGLMFVAAATRRAGHEVDFLDLMFKENPDAVLHDRILAFEPDAIGISVRNIDDQNRQDPNFLLAGVRPVIERCRADSSATVILGGAGYSIFPDEVLQYLEADYGIHGEGEITFPSLLEKLAQGGDPSVLPGVHVRGRKGRIEEEFCTALDSLPLPDDEDWATVADPAGADTWIPIESRRGCPNFCSYCSTFSIQGRRVRTRSPHRIAAQIEKMARRGFRRFYFVDNSFNIPESQAIGLCDAIAGLGLELTWRAILYPHGVSEALVASMKRAGCFEVAMGFESGSPEVLKEMNKHFTPDEVRNACRLLADYGIRRIGFLLLGGPGETRESVRESLEFADSLGMDGLRTTVGIRIYPGTSLARRALAEGVIQSEDELLSPSFYLAPGLDPWILQAVKTGFIAK